MLMVFAPCGPVTEQVSRAPSSALLALELLALELLALERLAEELDGGETAADDGQPEGALAIELPARAALKNKTSGTI